MTKIFIDNDWQEYDYDTLYSERGYTNTPSTMLVVYDNSMSQLEGWSNTGFNWIEQDHQWYPNDETPYYVQQSSSVSLYKIDKKTTFKVYLNNNEPFIIYNDFFTTVENLHNTLGYTQTPSTVWDIDEGVPWSWYNSDTEEYWNNKTHEWTTNPPKEEDEGEPEVLPNPMPLVEVDYSYDMDEPIILGGLKTYVEHYPVKEWELGELLKPVDSDFTSEDLILVWRDDLSLNVPLYIVNTYGRDFQGVHYNYGDSILVDIFTVMVDAQGEQTFYKDLDTYVFPYLYDSLSVSLKHYWVESDGRYYTESELLLLGFTTTPQTLCYYTELPLTYNSPKTCSYNEDNGYYVNGRWYSNVNDLNTDGYYLVSKVSKHIYLQSLQAGTSWNYDYNVVRSTTSFRTGSSYIRRYYLDSDLTQPFLWDGNDWFVDTKAVYNSEYFVSHIEEMPSSKTGSNNQTRLLTLMTVSGNPLNPFISSEINTQVYLHIATTYNSVQQTNGNIFKDLIIMYWELV